MNKEKVKKQFYLTIDSKTTEYCYEREMEYEDCYSHSVADENIIIDNGKVTAIRYKGLTWTLDEVGVQKTVQESNHSNGMRSIYKRENVTLKELPKEDQKKDYEAVEVQPISEL